jgi:hypothetical protein
LQKDKDCKSTPTPAEDDESVTYLQLQPKDQNDLTDRRVKVPVRLDLEARKGGSNTGHEQARREFEPKTPQDYPILKLTEAFDEQNQRTPVKISLAM